MNRSLQHVIILFLIFFMAQPTLAATDINFSGTLVAVTCKVSDQEKIEVNFGNDVVTELIDGQRYLQSVPLKISCNKDYTGDLNFSIHGTVSAFEDTALRTNVEGLGIRILDAKSNKALEINKSYAHKNHDDVNINVVPVKEKNADLQGGNFFTDATLLIEPQ